jgi:outer membrane protein OmpA-like peptidoglycan-associated protein/opacity protein-like surface antigen
VLRFNTTVLIPTKNLPFIKFKKGNPMTRNLNNICATALVLLFSTMAFAQPSTDVVKNKAQQEDYEAGKAKYPAKPKDMWELGLHGGYFQIAGDVAPEFGWAAGLHIRKSLGYVFALRLTGHYGVAKGLNHNYSMYGVAKNTALGARGLGYGPSRPFYHNFKSTYAEVSLQGIFTLNNLKFHKDKSRWDLFMIAGLGGNMYTTKHNAMKDEGNVDADGNPVGPTYDYIADAFDNSHDLNTRAGRSAQKDAIRAIHDNTYETYSEKWDALFSFLGPEAFGRANAVFNAGIGLGYRINKRMSVTLEHEATFNDDDLVDGYRWAEQGDVTRDVDVPQYTNLRVNFHLGSFKKQVMPLWWLNPLDAPYQQMAKNTIKKDPEEMLKDEDDDGVPDLLDKEPGTPADCPVDTRGVTLDSDSDGVPDCQDKEPYSPPGYPVNPDGVAQVPGPLTNDDVQNMLNDPSKNPGHPNNPANPVSGKGGMGDWFLPMVHFDLDKYYIKPEFYPQIKHVADMLKRYPELQIVVEGHTDIRKPNAYNQVLSYNRAKKVYDFLIEVHGISASQLVLSFQGEETVLIDGLKDAHIKREEAYHYMNRRVEFRVADGDKDKSRPEGPEAGSDKY